MLIGNTSYLGARTDVSIQSQNIENSDSSHRIVFDFFVIGGLIFLSKIFAIPLLLYFLMFYIFFRILTSPIQFSFAYLLILIPNLGVVFVPGIPAPLLNILIPLAIFKIFISKIPININKSFLLISSIFIMYEWLHAFVYDIYNVVTLISWTLTIVYVTLIISCKNIKYNHETNIKYFVNGIVISSLYGLYTNYLETGSIVHFARSTVTDRFVGGSGDPNYYSLYILISIFCLVLLANKENIKFSNSLKYYILVLLLPVLGFMSLSRMFIIVLVFVGFLYVFKVLFSIGKYNKHKKFILFFVGIVTILFSMFPNKIISNIELTISRFTMYEGDLASLTSNRNLIIEQSLEFLNSNPLYLYFGVGIQDYGSRIGSGMGYAHNIIIELLLAWGIIGTIIFIVFFFFMLIEVKNSNNLKSSSLLGWFPLICMAISYMSINAIEVESFYILLIFCMKNIYYFHK